MINKRLIGTVKESKKYVALNVFLQWLSLLANIVLMWTMAELLQLLYEGAPAEAYMVRTALTAIGVVFFRFFSNILSSRMGYMASKEVKRTLRSRIYSKLLRLGASYKKKIQTGEVVQLTVEGVEQLETYFGAYLPQFFYAMIAPLTLFAVLSQVSLLSAVILLICVPLIPISIAVVQTWAKKLLGKYWSQYTALGDTFLENLQGLLTLKIYESDGFKHEEMNRQAENFRRITMKVLAMQLNSIAIMDFVAYGGAALGIAMAIVQFRAGNVDVAGALLIILLSADFFLPMRLLGSFFHVAMNGMAASDKIFRLLDVEEVMEGTAEVPENCSISCQDVRFSYEQEREIIKDVSMEFPVGSFVAIVGESGCGKSTMAGIIMGKNRNYSGSIRVGAVTLADIKEESLLKSFTYINHQSYIFKGTVRENLMMADDTASDEMLWEALERVNLADFLREEKGLETPVQEKGANLSGGQCQRLALARAILHNSKLYIFDEATSNIDVESENDIMREINRLAKEKTVIVISHRLANVAGADNIYVMDKGMVTEKGHHEELLALKGTYHKLWNAQKDLEEYDEEKRI